MLPLIFRGISNQLNLYDSLKQDLRTPMRSSYPVSAFITHLVHLKNSTVEVDTAEITVSSPSSIQPPFHTDSFAKSMGVRCVEVQAAGQHFDAQSAGEALGIINVSYLP